MSKERELLKRVIDHMVEMSDLPDSLINEIEECLSEPEETAYYALLSECMTLLEYATYHDGRYGQDKSYDRFQWPAQDLVKRIAKRLERKAY